MSIKGLLGRRDWIELAHEERGNIFPTFFYWRGVQLACKLVEYSHDIIGVWYKNKGFSWIITKGALANPGKKILENMENKGFLDKIVEINKTGVPKMLKDSEWFVNNDLSQKKGIDIYKQWKLFEADFLDMMKYSVLGTVMEFEESLLSNMLMEELTKIVGKDKAGEYFTELTMLTEFTSAQKEEQDLIKIGLKQLEGKNVEEDIMAHWKKYAWVSFNYDGPGWSLDDIKKRLDMLSPDKQKLEKLTTLCEERRKKQEVLAKELNLSEKQRYMFHVLRTLGFWKFERKLLNGKSHYMLENLMKEIARRFDITLQEAKMILPSEMKDVLVNENIDKKLLKQRCKLAIAIYKDYEEYECFSGKQALEIEKDILESLKVDPNITEISGSTAYKGYAKGKVRIVNKSEEMKSFEQGDILVSASTSPEIIIAMRKAAAIVTDSGGITSHAAIVVRELKVPTIIGTKCASKILKNDELVEVDAVKGIIRRINHEKT